MGSRDFEVDYVNELKQFFLFLGSVWGLLSGISIFFPLSNTLLRAIPLGAYGDGGVFDELSPALITALATVVTLFVVLTTFATRDRFRDPMSKPQTFRAAWLAFGAGFVSLVAYLVLHQVYREYAWEPWGWGSGDPRKLFAEVPLLMAYIAFFSLLTRAFMLLGMIEFFGRDGDRNDRQGGEHPR